jgi:TMEM175 potassium channel family protein
MSKGRMEAFSDGVIAILITIMVLDLKVPEGTDLQALVPLGPVFVSYVLSFALLGTYWNNHHHLIQATKVVDGRVLLANLHLLFWLSLFPFVAAWMGESVLAPVPTAVYGFVLLMAAVAFYVLARALIAAPGQVPTLATAIGDDRKGKISPIVFATAIPVSLVAPLVAFAMYSAVVLVWVIPDRRMERTLTH